MTAQEKAEKLKEALFEDTFIIIMQDGATAHLVVKDVQFGKSMDVDDKSVYVRVIMTTTFTDDKFNPNVN